MIGHALAFLCGDFALQQFTQLPTLMWLVVIGAIACIMARLRYFYGLFFLLGFLWSSGFAHYQLSEQLASSLEGELLTLTGEISSLPDQNTQRAHFEFTLTDNSPHLPHKIQLAWYKPTAMLHAGETWTLAAKLKRNHSNFNLGSQDFERWQFTQGIGASGTVSEHPAPVRQSASSMTQINRWRETIGNQFTARYGNTLSVALLKALTIGDDNGLSPTQWDIFRITGTTHLIVISGSHIALVAGLIYWLTLKICACLPIFRYSPPQMAAIASIFTAITYASLAGFVVPTKRAVIMLGIVMIAGFYQRQISHLHSLALAILGILILNPLALLSIGFWLSFLAVVLIMYRVDGRLKPTSNWQAGVDIQLSVSIGLSPLILLFFQQVSLISPLVNFVAVPVVELFLVPFALILVPLVFIAPVIADKLFFLLDSLLTYFMQGLEWSSTLPFATINHPQPSGFAFALSCLGLLWLFAPRGIPNRALGLILNLPLLFPIAAKLNTGEAVMTLLDVSQGLSVSVQTQNHSLLFDTGAKFLGGGDMGKNVILPFLNYQNIKKLDMLMISHGDNDHIGGADTILKNLPVDQIVTSVPDKFDGKNAIYCNAPQNWDWDGVTFSVLSPVEKFDDENNNSCVLKIQTLSGSVLLTGDIEAKAEHWLVSNAAEQLQSTILVAPHHGSKTSSTQPFIEAVHPETILIPNGYRNQFKHPSKEVIARYRDLNIPYLTSANDGAITVSLKNDHLKIESLRGTDGKYWNFQKEN